jgi:RNA polymerase sigma-32 factor
MAHGKHQLDEYYVQRIKKMPILALEEEFQLAKEYRDTGDQKAIERILQAHLRLVTKVAQGYRGYGLSMSDLVAEGNLGMMHAMKHFDPEKGFRFSTYAQWWIRANIQEYILRTFSLVKMGTTSGQKKLFFGLKRAKHEQDPLDFGSLSPESAEKIAKKLDVRVDEVYQMNQRLGSKDLSLNKPLSSDEETSEWMEWIPDNRITPEVHAVEKSEMKKRRDLLNQALMQLKQRDRDILKRRRLSDPPETLEVLSQEFGVSRERIRQIEMKAFASLQKIIKQLAIHSYHPI